MSNRDAEILRMRQEGASYREIAQAFNLSLERIRQIVKQDSIASKREQMYHFIAEETRLSNDLDKKWPCSDFLYAFGFSKRAISVLMKHFESSGMQVISLKELLDFLLPNDYSGNDYTWMNVPAFRVKYLGITIYRSVVNKICELDLGITFQEEVSKRKEKLIKHLKSNNILTNFL
jgi:hypothetical protein